MTISEAEQLVNTISELHIGTIAAIYSKHPDVEEFLEEHERKCLDAEQCILQMLKESL